MISCVVPVGFVERHLPKHTWWMKIGWETIIQQAYAQVTAGTAPPIRGGRGTVHRVMLGDQGAALVRHYQRGGLIRYFVHDLYWDRPPRPFAELICTETARQRGVSTVEVLGARVEWETIGLYRGLLVTREAQGFINLWEWLRTQPTGREREATVIAVARAIARLHAAGIEHADLNLTNILVRGNADTPPVLIIDFDRARLFPAALPRDRCERNLRRLRRSLDKLDPAGLLFSPADPDTFCRAYHEKS